jgi:type I restriction enzyme S subunit
MEEGKEYRLGDIGRIITGKTPSTACKTNYGGKTPFLTPSDDLSVKHTYKTIKTLSEQGVSSVINCLIPAESICVSCIGSDLGKVTIINTPAVTNQQINSIVVNKDKFDIDFVYYSMKIIGRLMNYHSKTSTAVPIINKTQFSNYKIKIPSLPTQQKIAAILSSLDDKIELNNKTNTNLEQQAGALFKNWFVDFEPFGGKMPEGWKVGKLSEIGTIVGGSTPSKAKKDYYTNNGIAWITPKDLSNDKSKFISHGETDITELGFENSSAIKMPKGTVLYSSRAPIGYIAIAKNEVTTNQGFKSVIPNPNVGNAYIYYFLKSNFELIDNMASGSTFKEISGTAMKNIPVVIPDNKNLLAFQSYCNSLFDEQEKLEEENRTLSALRNTLLPKLMSGEIEVDTVAV